MSVILPCLCLSVTGVPVHDTITPQLGQYCSTHNRETYCWANPCQVYLHFIGEFFLLMPSYVTVRVVSISFSSHSLSNFKLRLPVLVKPH